MSQAPLSIGANKPGITYRQEDTNRARAIATHHAGAAAPSYAETHIAWMDTSGTPWKLKIYDGADWITSGEYNAVTNTFIPYVGTAPIRLINHVADSGAANAYVLAPTHAVPAYTVGQIVTLRPANANTGACTLALSALSAKAIKLNNGDDPHANAMRVGGVYALMYDGVNWQLLNPTWPFGGLAFLDVLDEDDFASNSATRPPSQQSVAQYIADNAAGAYEHLATATASASASLDFTGIFTDDYSCFDFVLLGLQATSATLGDWGVRTSANGGVTWGASNGVYSWKSFGVVQLGGSSTDETAVASVSNQPTSHRFHLHNGAHSTAAASLSGRVRVMNMPDALRWTTFESQLVSVPANSGAMTRAVGGRTTAEVNDAIRFFVSNGTIAAGTIHCYGVKNS